MPSVATVPNLFSTDKVRNLTEEESGILLQCSIIERQEGFNPITVDELSKEFGEDAPFAVRVFMGRLVAANPNMLASKFVVIWLTMLCRTPGDAVMWAWALYQTTKKNGAPSMADIYTEYMPMGIPTDDEMHRIWDSQKWRPERGSDNWLDSSEAWS